MKPVSIRKVQSEDLIELIQIQVKSIQTLCLKEYNPQQIQTLIADKSRPRDSSELIFVAETDNQIVGFSALSDSGFWICGLFVHPNFVRQKIGTQLLIALESEAISRKNRCLWVHSSLTAEPFYRKQGYQALKKTHISVFGILIPVILMKKVLIPPTETEKTLNQLFCLLIVIFLFIVVVVPLLT